MPSNFRHEKPWCVNRTPPSVLCLRTRAHTQNWRTAARKRQSHKTDALESVTAGASSSSPTAQATAVTPTALSAAATRVSIARSFLGAGAFLTQVQGHTRRCACPFWFPTHGASCTAVLRAFAGPARGVPCDHGFSKQDADMERPPHV